MEVAGFQCGDAADTADIRGQHYASIPEPMQAQAAALHLQDPDHDSSICGDFIHFVHVCGVCDATEHPEGLL
ncbi:hypothetical protein OIY81_3158 [Cryptosporidium canis]|nr:hypothetical protein OIY81_3158 [Cryptosporidium canis]